MWSWLDNIHLEVSELCVEIKLRLWKTTYTSWIKIKAGIHNWNCFEDACMPLQMCYTFICVFIQIFSALVFTWYESWIVERVKVEFCLQIGTFCSLLFNEGWTFRAAMLPKCCQCSWSLEVVIESQERLCSLKKLKINFCRMNQINENES